MPMLIRRSFRAVRAAVLFACLGVVAACGPGYLDVGQKVPATEPNKEVFEVLRAYHAAIEGKDVDALKKLVSPKYHSNGGTTETPDDDFGIDRLAESMPMLRDNVKKVQLRMRLLDMNVGKDVATVDFEFVGRVLLTEGGVDRYKTFDDFNRMTLEREGGDWRIVGGL